MSNIAKRIWRWLRKSTRGDVMAFAGVIIGIGIGYIQIRVAIRLANQDETLKKLDTLSAKTNIQIDRLATINEKLSGAVSDLNGLLTISEHTQKQTNINTQIKRQADIDELYLASKDLYELWFTWQLNDSTPKATIKYFKAFLENSKKILESQKSNSFLYENDQLSHQWFSVLELTSHTLNSFDVPLNPEDSAGGEWMLTFDREMMKGVQKYSQRLSNTISEYCLPLAHKEIWKLREEEEKKSAKEMMIGADKLYGKGKHPY